MSFLNLGLVFLLIPLFLLYRNDKSRIKKEKKMLYISLFFVILALMRPVIEQTPTQEKVDAQEYIIAIDASFSMQADDIKPTRFIAAKNSAKKLMQLLNKDRFTLFVFTSNALLISPPTTDTTISLMALDAIDPNYILTKSTSLKNLLKTVGTFSDESKKLIIYTDGGEENDINTLTQLTQEGKITPYIVASASKKGTLLKKNAKTLLDEEGNLIISRLNPILQEYTKQNGGKFFTITSANVESSLATALQHQNTNQKNLQLQISAYLELFYYPLLLALLFFILATTRINKLLLPLTMLLSFGSAQAHAEKLLDFYNIKEAHQAYLNKEYKKAVNYFSKVTPSPQSYYNKALALYRLHKYKEAAKTLALIKTQNPSLKEKILYTLGNCAFKLKKYDKSKIYYKKALTLEDDKDAYANLLLIYKLQLEEKKEIYQSLKKEKTNQKSGASQKKKSNTKEKKNSTDSKNSSSNASTKATQDNQKRKAIKKSKEQKYKFGYKAYELINKGYTNEQHPW